MGNRGRLGCRAGEAVCRRPFTRRTVGVAAVLLLALRGELPAEESAGLRLGRGLATNGSVELQWPAQRGAIYQVDSIDRLPADPTENPWRARQSGCSAISPMASWLDAGDALATPAIVAPAETATRFYRVNQVGQNSPGVVYLDATTGDDGTGTLGDSGRPFKSWANAIRALDSNGTLLMAPGVYPVATCTPTFPYPYGSAAVLECKRNIRIEGGGAVLQASGRGNLLRVTSGTNIQINGLEFRGAGSHDNTNAALNIFALLEFDGTNSNCSVTRSRFIDSCNHGVAYLYGAGYRNFHDGTIAFNYFENCGQTNVAGLGGDGAAIACTGNGNLYLGNYITNCLRGIELEGLGDVRWNRIIGNHFQGVWSEAICVLNTGFQSGTYLGNVIQNNVIRGPDRCRFPGSTPTYPFGILWGGGGQGVISDNWIDHMPSGGGIALNACFSDIHDMIVSGNQVFNVQQRPIQAVNILASRQCYRITISGNLCVGAANDNPGILVAGDRITVQGNHVESVGGDGIKVEAYEGGSEGTVISQNRIHDYGRAGGSSFAINLSESGITNAAVWGNVASAQGDGLLRDRGTRTRKSQAFVK
jgi:hypothetical protein